MPRIRNFMRMWDDSYDTVPEKDLIQTPDIKPDRFNRDTHGVAAVRRWLKERDEKPKGKQDAPQDA